MIWPTGSLTLQIVSPPWVSLTPTTTQQQQQQKQIQLWAATFPDCPMPAKASNIKAVCRGNMVRSCHALMVLKKPNKQRCRSGSSCWNACDLKVTSASSGRTYRCQSLL